MTTKWRFLFILANICFVAGCDSKPRQQDATSELPKSAVRKEYQEIARYSGNGNQDTESFNLMGGKVKMVARTWTTSRLSDGTTSGHYSGIGLKAEDGTYLSGADLSISVKTAEGSAETIVRNTKPGSYYVSVITGVNWEVTVYEEK